MKKIKSSERIKLKIQKPENARMDLGEIERNPQSRKNMNSKATTYRWKQQLSVKNTSTKRRSFRSLNIDSPSRKVCRINQFSQNTFKTSFIVCNFLKIFWNSLRHSFFSQASESTGIWCPNSRSANTRIPPFFVGRRN